METSLLCLAHFEQRGFGLATGAVDSLPCATNMRRALFASLSCIASTFAFADEGMWLFNQTPREVLRDRYHFDATDAWLDHLQKSSVRFNSGGSGSFEVVTVAEHFARSLVE